MKIFPSILETQIDAFWQQIKKMIQIFPYFQIDIADGQLVANKTVQIEEIIRTISNFQFLISKHQLEFHLMVDDYFKEIKKLKKLVHFIKIKKILIHLNALKESNFQFLTSNFQPPDSLFSYGLVLNPKDGVKENWPVIKKFSTTQIMTVNPGFQGSPFLPKNLEKINELRELGYQGIITLDGAINDETLPIVLKNKYLPDVVFPGSFLREKPGENLEILKKLSEINSH